MPEVSLFSESTNNIRPMPQKLLYDRRSASYVLSISTRALDYLIANKQLAPLRLGKKIMLSHQELTKFCRSNHLSLTANPVTDSGL